jgi:PAS domain S-box-containing protein
MIGIKNRNLSPLVSFDLYLEHYHQLINNLKKEVDLKQMSHAIREHVNNETQAILKEENYDALVVTSFDQTIVWVNQGFTEMTGYNKNFALGKKPSFLQGDKTSKTTVQDIGKQLKNKQCYTGAITNYRKNGETYQCEIKILPLYNSNKELTHFIALERESKAA